jgi:hypothetical protein
LPLIFSLLPYYAIIDYYWLRHFHFVAYFWLRPISASHYAIAIIDIAITTPFCLSFRHYYYYAIIDFHFWYYAIDD